MAKKHHTQKRAAPKPPLSGRIFAYVRVSTQAQTVVEQQHQIERWAAARGSVITESFIDAAVSALTPFRERPAGAALWAILRPGDAIVAAWLDRMFRSAPDCLAVTEALQAQGVRLYLLDTDNGTSDVLSDTSLRMRLYIGASFAEQESGRTGRRIQVAKQGQRARGEYSGGIPPFGYRREGDMLVRVPELQAAIARMKALRAEGASLRAIAEALRSDGIAISHVGVGNALQAAEATGQSA